MASVATEIVDSIMNTTGTKKSKKHTETPATPKSSSKDDRSEMAETPVTPVTPGDEQEEVRSVKKGRNPFAHMTVEQRKAHKENMKKLRELRAAQEKAYDFDGMMKNLRKFNIPKNVIDRQFVTCLVPLVAADSKELVAESANKALRNLLIGSFICQIKDGKKTMTHQHVISAMKKIGFGELLGI